MFGKGKRAWDSCTKLEEVNALDALRLCYVPEIIGLQLQIGARLVKEAARVPASGVDIRKRLEAHKYSEQQYFALFTQSIIVLDNVRFRSRRRFMHQKQSETQCGMIAQLHCRDRQCVETGLWQPLAGGARSDCA